MNEIEVKILDIDKQKVVNKILELGGKLLFENKQFHAIYYKSPENQTIRIRKEGDITVICHKEKIESQNGLKSMKETEIETKDFENSVLLLEKLGFEKRPNEIQKTRTSYKLDNCKIEFDIITHNGKNLPEFLEIEAQNEKDLINTANKLGFDKSEFKTWSQHELIKHYQNN